MKATLSSLPFKMPVLDWDKIESRPITVPDDPIAYGCAAYRDHRDPDAPGPRWPDFDLIKITDQDRLLAKTIRSYYKARLTVRKLKQGRLTAFANDLYHLVAEPYDPEQSITKQLGMIYRLPYFYYEDLARDQLLDQFRDHQPELSELPGKFEARRLYPVCRILQSRRSQETIEYWWKDDRHEPVLWEFSYQSGFDALVGSLAQQESVELSSYFYTAKQPGTGMSHWSMSTFYTRFLTNQ